MSLKSIVYGKNALLSLLFLETLYISYSYLIADRISIELGANGFQNDTIFTLSYFELVLSTFLVPPLEELIARIYLNKELKYFNLSFLFLLLTSLLFFLYSKVISLVIFIIFLLAILIGFLKGFNFLKQKMSEGFVYFFLFYSFVFAFAHIPAINSTYKEIDFGTRLIVVTLSIFPFSIILGLVRLKYGLKYSILLHILNNGLIISLNSIMFK